LMRAVVLAVGSVEKDDPAYYRRDFLRYFKVSPADVRRVAERYLADDKVALVIRPARPGEPEPEAVRAGPKPDGSTEAHVAERSPAPGPDWSKLPGPSEPRPFKAPPIVRRNLSNGLDVWISPWHTLPIIDARFLIRAGTADDPEGKSGL